MKTKKFFMTSLLVMGMIIAKAANGYPPELVLVSQPVLTYNSNSVTIYYDVQNIGDYTYRGDLCIYLDPDNGYCYASEYMKIKAGAIKRIEVSIPAYRPNPSVTYTVMPYYELYDELYSFTTFEYFEPVRFCWYGYRNEPWVVIHIGPRPHHYDRPGDYRYYYDGYHPMMHPAHPDRPLPPADPIHHTYGYHHNHGGYPANYYPDNHVPGYNPPEHKPNDNPGNNGGPGHSENPGNNGASGNNGNSGATVVHPNGSHTPGSMSSSGAGTSTGNTIGNTVNNNSGATSRPSSGNSGATSRPSSGNSSNSGATSRPSSGNSGTVNRPSSGNSGTVSRPSSGNSSNSGATSRPSSGNSGTVNRPSSGNSGTVSRPSSGNSSTVNRPSSGNSSSGRTGTSSSSGSGRSSNSSSSSSSRGSSSSSGSSSRSSSSSTRGR